MEEEHAPRSRQPGSLLLLAATLVLLLLSASRLAQTLFLGGLRLDRALENASRVVDRQPETPPADGAEADLAAAGDDLRRYLTARPLDAEAQFLSYRLARLENRRVDAELALFRCSLARPADSRMAYMRGIFLLQGGRFKEGLAFFSQSLRLDTGHLDEIFHDCMSIFSRRYETFKYIFPEKRTVRERLALLLRHDLLMEESIEEYLWCLARAPDSASLRYELSLAYRGNGEIGKALAAVDQALRLDPERMDYSRDRGEYLLRLGRVEEAIEVCQSLVASRPAYKDAYILWAKCHEQEGKTWEAIRVYRDALWRVREKGIIHQLIGDHYVKMGRHREALDEYQTGLQTAVNDYSRKFALFRIGTCYERMKMPELALESLIQADAIHPEFKDLDPLVADALERLTAVKAAEDE